MRDKVSCLLLAVGVLILLGGARSAQGQGVGAHANAGNALGGASPSVLSREYLTFFRPEAESAESTLIPKPPVARQDVVGFPIIPDLTVPHPEAVSFPIIPDLTAECGRAEFAPLFEDAPDTHVNLEDQKASKPWRWGGVLPGESIFGPPRREESASSSVGPSEGSRASARSPRCVKQP